MTFCVCHSLKLLKISTHTPHAGRDDKGNPRIEVRIISTHTPHAGRDQNLSDFLWTILISTHTPHAGRDGPPDAEEPISKDFNSHAPRGA